MLTGSDSAPAKANEAKQKNDIGTAKDDVSLTVQNALTDAYVSAYVNGNSSRGSASTDVGEYVISIVKSKYNAKPEVSSATVEVNANGDIRVYTTDFEEKGEISKSGGVLTWKGITSNTGKTILTEETGPTLSDITSANYGDYINLGTSILPTNTTIGEGDYAETIKADWRIFYKDPQGNVYAKLADYLPVDTGTVGASVVASLRLDTYNKYGVYVDYSGDYTEDYEGQDYGIGDRNIFLEKLNGNWNGLLSGSNIETIQEQLGTKINVKGAVDLPTWVASWNSNTGYTQLYANYDNNDKAYMIGTSTTNNNSSIDLSSETGYNNTLYFPNKSESGSSKDDCYGCWVASPGPESPDVEGIVWYEYDSHGRLDAYDFYFGNGYIGVCPVVILKSDIPVEEVEEGLWEVK